MSGVLAATRQLIWPADAPPQGTIRSPAYFLPVIDEVPALRVSPDCFAYLRQKLARAHQCGKLAQTRDDAAPTAR
jgi:hypothetical protein